MKHVHEEEWKHPNGLDNHIIMATLFYDKSKGGYRASIVPATISKKGPFMMREFGAFTGFNVTLLQVARQSAKQLEACKAILAERKEEFLSKFKDNLIEVK